MPPLTAGAGPGAEAQSVRNLVEWLDAIIEANCKKSRRVRDEAGDIAPGSFKQRLSTSQEEHYQIYLLRK